MKQNIFDRNWFSPDFLVSKKYVSDYLNFLGEKHSYERAPCFQTRAKIFWNE